MSPFRGSAPLAKEWPNFRFELNEDHVGTITFNRPDKLNALTFEVYADLRDLLTELPRHEDVRALIITGTGRGFCSGGDVHEIIGKLIEMGPRDLLDFTRMTGSVVQRMRECPLPIIAAVNGIAAGAGSVIALAADFRLLAATASFSFLFTKVGLAGADMGSAYLLPRLIGYGRATELLMLGERVDAQTAVRIGLAMAAVDDGELAPRARELARKLATGPTLAYATTKMLLSRELDLDMAGALELEAMAQALLMKSDDHVEFYEAFRSGRDPKWSGR
jgi:enoyl-CoA hydratase/carnithine racemase